MKFLIVGAGFAGATAARVLADHGHKILIIDTRNHIGGNAYDYIDEHGVLVHKYGPHIFHTNSKKIFEFLSRFTEWRKYEHKVLASIKNMYYPIPVNRKTLSLVEGVDFSEKQAEEYFRNNRINYDHPKNSEEVVLNSVGPKLCEMFFSGYTRKQWGMDLKDLSAGVAARIPTRINDDDRYFSDQFQYMPVHGYTSMFERMLNHENIEIKLNTDYFSVKKLIDADHTIYTGPIDAYFDYVHGKLPYRSLRFVHEHHAEIDEWQAVGTVNYPNEHEFTRITEMKKLTGQKIKGTSIVKEYPVADGDPYYPVPKSENQEIYKKYAELIDKCQSVSFVGRLSEYKYYNMDQVVGSALAISENLK